MFQVTIVWTVICAKNIYLYANCYLISRTLVSVVNSFSRALRNGLLCKSTHGRRSDNFSISGALQMLELIDWLIDRIAYLLLAQTTILIFLNFLCVTCVPFRHIIMSYLHNMGGDFAVADRVNGQLAVPSLTASINTMLSTCHCYLLFASNWLRLVRRVL